MLTAAQKRVFDFIVERVRTTGACPSQAEIGRGLRYKGKAAVHAVVGRLIDRGYLRRCRQSPFGRTSIDLVRPLEGRYFRFDDTQKRLVEWHPGQGDAA